MRDQLVRWTLLQHEPLPMSKGGILRRYRFGRRPSNEGSHETRRTSATACAASPSPRPVNPRPSVVVARTLTELARDAERAREPLAHLVPVRRDPRLLADHDAVGVDELVAGRCTCRVRLGEKDERVRAAIALVVGREERADVGRGPPRRAAHRSARGRPRRRPSGRRGRADGRSRPRRARAARRRRTRVRRRRGRCGVVSSRASHETDARRRRQLRESTRSTSAPRVSAAAAPTARVAGGPRRAPPRGPGRTSLSTRSPTYATSPAAAPASSTRRSKNSGSGFRTPRLAEPVTMSTGSAARAPSPRAPRSGCRPARRAARAPAARSRHATASG